jgi:hypothetical protein
MLTPFQNAQGVHSQGVNESGSTPTPVDDSTDASWFVPVEKPPTDALLVDGMGLAS